MFLKEVIQTKYMKKKKCLKIPEFDPQKTYVAFLRSTFVQGTCLDMRCELGLNVYQFFNDKKYEEEGFFFTDIECALYYIKTGSIIAVLSIPADAKVIESGDYNLDTHEYIAGWICDKFIIEKFLDVTESSTIEWLIDHGANPFIRFGYLFIHALRHNKKIWDMLENRYPEEAKYILNDVYGFD